MALDFSMLDIFTSVPYIIVSMVFLGLAIFFEMRLHSRSLLDRLFPAFLSNIVKNLEAGISIEQAFYDVSRKSGNYLGNKIMEIYSDKMSFDENLQAAAGNLPSKLVRRTFSIIMAARKAGASMSETVQKISEDFMSMYLLHREKLEKMRLEATLVLFIGVVFTPLTLAVFLGMFQIADVGLPLPYLLLAAAASSTLFYGIIMEKELTSMLLVPFALMIASITFSAMFGILGLYLSPA